MRFGLSTVLLTLAYSVHVLAQVAEWGQCGGTGYTGSTSCTPGNTCQYSNPWYSQCLPGSSGGSSGGVSTPKRTTEWHPGGAFGVGNNGNSGFNIDGDCIDVELIRPDFITNWGPNNRHDSGINVCNDNAIHFLPTLWGQSWDDSQLSGVPNCPAPWGVIFENEPNWASSGPNWTAQYTASKYFGHIAVINEKWGLNNVKLISPSPVNPTYPNCGPGVTEGCAFQQQTLWLQQYFASCGCENQIWAINHHEYSCDMAITKQNIQRLWTDFNNKNVFVGEIGCGGSPASQAQYLMDFATWAYTQPNLVGFIWIGVNNVGGPNNVPVANWMMTDGYGHLTVVGQTYLQIQQQFPPLYL